MLHTSLIIQFTGALFDTDWQWHNHILMLWQTVKIVNLFHQIVCVTDDNDLVMVNMVRSAPVIIVVVFHYVHWHYSQPFQSLEPSDPELQPHDFTPQQPKHNWAAFHQQQLTTAVVLLILPELCCRAFLANILLFRSYSEAFPMQLIVIESMKASIRQIFHERIVADITLRFVTMMVGMVGCALVFPNNKDTSNISTEYCAQPAELQMKGVFVLCCQTEIVCSDH